MFVFLQAEQRGHTQIRTRVSAVRPYATKEAGGVQWYVLRRRKIKTGGKKTKRQYAQDARIVNKESKNSKVEGRVRVILSK